MPPLIPLLYLILPTYEQDNYVAEMGLVSTFDMCQNYFITKMYIKYETIANIMRSAARATHRACERGVSIRDSANTVLQPYSVLI